MEMPALVFQARVAPSGERGDKQIRSEKQERAKGGRALCHGRLRCLIVRFGRVGLMKFMLLLRTVLTELAGQLPCNQGVSSRRVCFRAWLHLTAHVCANAPVSCSGLSLCAQRSTIAEPSLFRASMPRSQ